MQSGKRFAVRAAILVASVGFSAVGMTNLSHAQDAAKTPPVETAGHRFKNIQILKDMPADQLMPTMEKFNQSLGVRCNYCHVRPPESDAKPEKKTARKMLVMTMNLNKSQPMLHGSATCYMCHHGHAEPENKVPDDAEGK